MGHSRLRQWLLSTLAIGLGALSSSVFAQGTLKVDINGGRLGEALGEFSAETGAELLFDQQLVEHRIAPPVQGTLTASDALSRLLAGSGVSVREVSGSFVLFAQSSHAASEVADDLSIPEILVTGRRTQNVDIRRTENDVQPYKLTTRRDIERAHRSNIEEYTRTRLPANVQMRSFAQDATRQRAVTRSALDLRGLGRRRTLVLVDGKRLPSVRTVDSDFDQADLNGVPLIAVERIETLTGTAGGIYGPSALGGVVNVVLRRDYRGADLHATSGITSRGEAEFLRIEGRAGFTPNDGRTNVMVLASHHMSEPLLAGQRDYELQARRRQFANDPAAYLARRESGNSVTVYNLRAQSLVLDPEFGGTSLGAAYSYLPIGFSGTRSEAIEILRQNAGKVDLSLPADRSGSLEYISSVASVTSGLVNIRHSLSEHMEIFVDGFHFRNSGSFITHSLGVSPNLPAASANNPFTDPITFRFPLPSAARSVRETVNTARLSAGLIAKLPSGWSAAADHSTGFVRQASKVGGPELNAAFTNAIVRGEIDPLANWADVIAGTAAYLLPRRNLSPGRTRFTSTNLRLGGPLVRLPAGPVALTLLAEHGSDHVPQRSIEQGAGFPRVFLPEYKQAVSSAYAELRTPISIGREGGLRGSELQLAVRYDRARTSFSPVELRLEPRVDPLTTILRDGLNYTVGAKIFPLPRLMLRASVATGELYPTIPQIRQRTNDSPFAIFIVSDLLDPKRGGEPIGGGEKVRALSAGSPDNRPEKATTISAGAVFNPLGENGPRLSVDYSRIEKRREILQFFGERLAVVANEEAFPGRLTRAPLTEADARRGFTAGRVVEIDLSDRNAGTTIADAVDIEFDWRVPFVGESEVQIYGSGTWHPRLKQRRRPGQPWIDRVGHFDGPLAWRGNLGAEWTQGPLSIDLNVQFFDSYRITYADPFAANEAMIFVDNAQALRYQGSERIPSQAYVDLSLKRRFELVGRLGPVDSVQVRLGVQNVFDKRPPLIANNREVPYSTYGDARRRRFELSLSSEF